MKMRLLNLLLVILTVALATGLVAATKKAPPKKAPAKKPATTHHETVGTQQLQGGFGQIGHTYTLGKVQPWNIRLNSVEYSVDTLAVGDRLIIPKADEKLLVLHYNVHNPQKNEALMRFDTIMITAVDAQDKNWEFRGSIGNEATKAEVNQRMKPAQKMDVFAVIKVPAAGEIPKVIFKAHDDLVIRYDLRGKAKGLPAPYADPSDTTGATALGVVPAEMGTFYPTGSFALRLDSTSLSDQQIGDVRMEKGGRLLVIAATIKNLDKRPNLLRHDTFINKLRDADGADVRSRVRVLRATSDSDLQTNVDPGQELKLRMVLSLEKGIEPKTLAICQAVDGRVFQFEVN